MSFRILLIETRDELATLWAGFISRRDHKVYVACSLVEAEERLDVQAFDMLIINSACFGQDACSIVEYAVFRNPRLSVIAVTSDAFFSDGSLFEHLPNLRSHLPKPVAIDDLSAVVDHYAVSS